MNSCQEDLTKMEGVGEAIAGVALLIATLMNFPNHLINRLSNMKRI